MRKKGDKKLQIRNSTAEFLMFAVDSNQDGVEVRFKDETVWLSQKMMAVLFDCSSDNISLHLKNIFQNQELDKNSVTEEFSASPSKTQAGKLIMLNFVFTCLKIWCHHRLLLCRHRL